MQELIDQEKRLESEIKDLESRSALLEYPIRDYDCINHFAENQQQNSSKRFKQIDYNTFGSSNITRVHNHSPIEVLEVSIIKHVCFLLAKTNAYVLHVFVCTLMIKVKIQLYEKDEGDMDGRKDSSGMHNM